MSERVLTPGAATDDPRGARRLKRTNANPARIVGVVALGAAALAARDALAQPVPANPLKEARL